jgi:hypothetical protein
LQTLLHPEMLGRSFQALALAKNVDPGALRLAGFKFAREPCSALDLSTKYPSQKDRALQPQMNTDLHR